MCFKDQLHKKMQYPAESMQMSQVNIRKGWIPVCIESTISSFHVFLFCLTLSVVFTLLYTSAFTTKN